MLRVVMVLALVGAAAAGCTKSRIRAGEGIGCSTDPDDDPYYECSPAADLVCIATHSVQVTNERVARQFDGGIRQIYICRLACSPEEGGCRQAGDVCCPGHIVGRNYGKSHACVPERLCQTVPAPDGGVRPRDAGADRPGGDAAAVAGLDGQAGEAR